MRHLRDRLACRRMRKQRSAREIRWHFLRGATAVDLEKQVGWGSWLLPTWLLPA